MNMSSDMKRNHTQAADKNRVLSDLSSSSRSFLQTANRPDPDVDMIKKKKRFIVARKTAIQDKKTDPSISKRDTDEEMISKFNSIYK